MLGLEAQPAAPHDQGSSHGLSRIIRLAYFEHPSYVPLLRESYRLWRELEVESGEELLTLTGCINAAPAAQHDDTQQNCFQGALLSAQQHSLAHEVLSAAQVAARFPAYHLPPSFQTMHEPEGGLLAPEKCIAAHLRLAQQRHGAQMRCGTEVLGWQMVPPTTAAGTGGHAVVGSAAGSAAGRVDPGEEAVVEVHTSRGSFHTRRLVLAGGGWMPELVPELKPLLSVERQVVGWFQVEPAQRRHFSPAAFPVFLLQDGTGYYYGFPADQHGFKVGKYHHRREVTTADSVERGISPEDEEALRQCVRRYFPGANGRLTHAATCTFTNTPDMDFLLDRHPRWPQVVLCSACSGHGFKFAPAIGSILADLALNPIGSTPHDISLHRLSPERTGQEAVVGALLRGGHQ